MDALKGFAETREQAQDLAQEMLSLAEEGGYHPVVAFFAADLMSNALETGLRDEYPALFDQED
jgi:hypothetical protein